MLRRLLVSSAIAGTALLAPQVANAAVAQPEAQARCLFPTGIGPIDEFCATKWKVKSQLLGGLSGGVFNPGTTTDGDYSSTTSTVTPTDLNSYVHPLIVKIDGYSLLTVKGAKGPAYLWLGPDGPLLVDESTIDFPGGRFLVKPSYDCATAPTPAPVPAPHAY